MDAIDPAGRLLHAALEPAPGGRGCFPLSEARLTDRQRLGVLLQAAGLLSHLDQGGWHLHAGWQSAWSTPHGFLRGVEASPGRGGQPGEGARPLLCQLLGLLFGGADGLPGRGQARRAARGLAVLWRQPLVRLAPDEAVAQILRSAAFLWEPDFAEARQALAGEHLGPNGPRLWVAGSGAFRARVLARARCGTEAAALLGGPGARELWEDDLSSPVMMGLPAAAALFARGRFRDALGVLQESPEGTDGPESPESPESPEIAAAVLRLRCLEQLGELGAVRSGLRRLAGADLPLEALLDAAEVAVRVLAKRGESRRGAQAWVRRVLVAARSAAGPLRARAELLAAGAAWDAGDPETMAEHLAATRPDAGSDPRAAWRWHQMEGLRVLVAAESGEVGEAADSGAASFARALAGSRRHLARHEAAGLWNDLGLGRARQGDLAGAERAFRHSLRLFGGCDGPRRTTLALSNLAEIRLRRGDFAGVREILEESTAANRLSGNLRGLVQDAALWARYELGLGRPAAALALCREALARLAAGSDDWYRPELHALAARALGWLERPADAAAELGCTTAAACADLEPEERPALWAHAGDRDGALRTAAGGPAENLWTAALSGGGADLSPDQAAKLGDYRAARLAFDLDLAAPGAVSAPWRRAAIATLRGRGANLLAERLEARDEGPWRALAAYCEKPAGDSAALGRLFADAGYPEVELLREDEDGPWPVLQGPGGGEVLTGTGAAGRLVLRAERSDAPLQALFALACRDLPRAAPPAFSAPASGLVGDSPPLRAAVDRLARLAAGSFPVLVVGESGTGKELAARHVHRASPRAAGQFVAVNCAALSETLVLSDLFGHVRGAFTGADRDRAGLFETAHGGTVFLDEIGDLPATAQGMLLRVLQEGEVRRVGESSPKRVDVRVVAATHRDLRRLVAEGTFREDLFFRLQVGRVDLPPLRDRGRDVLGLAEHFLRRAAAREAGGGVGKNGAGRLSAAARERLLAYRWPGNVRELQNVLAVAATLAGDGAIEPEHLGLSEAPPAGSDYHREVDALRRRLVAGALAACRQNRAEAARRLGLSRQALSYLVRQLGLQ
jgi:two-component system, NtrC family, response regulator